MRVTSGPAPAPPGRLRALRQTLEQRLPGDSSRTSIDGAAPWVSGVLAASQALIFSLMAIMIPAIAMVVAAAAQIPGASTSWGGAMGMSAHVWLLGHSVPFTTGVADLTIVPLGVSAVAVFGAYVSARRSMTPHWSSLVSGVGTYVAGVVVIALLSGAVSPLQLSSAVLGGLAVALIGLTWGTLARPDSADLADGLHARVLRVPVLVRIGLRGGMVAAGVTVMIAGVVTLTWIVAEHTTVTDVVRGLSLDSASGVSLAVAQLALLPNLVVWALAWVAGPGFAVGAGTHFGLDSVTSAPLPALPLLGALPGPTTGADLGLWAPVLIGGAGVLGGWFVHRRLERIAWWHVFVLAGAVAVGAGAACGSLVALASGVGGPGRLAEVGASGTFLGLTIAAQVGIGALLVLVCVRREVWSAARRGWTSVRRSISDRAGAPEGGS